MLLMDIPSVKKWLTQFEVPDVYIAENMLRSMRYISFEEFEKCIHTSIQSLLEEIEKIDGRGAVAIFPVRKSFIHKYNKDKEVKFPNDSSGRIAHSLKNIERDLPNYVELEPRLVSMRHRKVRNIIYVDDFVGTGNRVIDFWRSSVSASIKSWCSFGWCKIWFITFAAHKSGIKHILKNIHPLELSRVKVEVEIDTSFMLKNASMREVLTKYGTPLGGGQVMGYGALATPVVFQHGCPNNVPLIFWLGSKRKSQTKWVPLFSNRSISSDVYPLFSGELTIDATAESLWSNGNYQMALNFLESISIKGREQHHLLLILTMLSNNRRLVDIKDFLLLSSEDFDALLMKLRIGGLINQNTILTRFGHDIIFRLEKKKKIGVKMHQEKLYFPSSFLGFHRIT